VERALREPRIVGRDRYRPALAALLFVAVGLALALAAARLVPTASPPELQVTDRDDGGSVRIARGGSLVVALASNPSTGYAWTVSERTGSGLVLTGPATYLPPGSTAPVVGAPGTEVLRFDAVSAGTYELRLEYRRSFEPNAAPERTFRVTVQID
jgi:inhibitor of cysteine peptidase